MPVVAGTIYYGACHISKYEIDSPEYMKRMILHPSLFLRTDAQRESADREARELYDKLKEERLLTFGSSDFECEFCFGEPSYFVLIEFLACRTGQRLDVC